MLKSKTDDIRNRFAVLALALLVLSLSNEKISFAQDSTTTSDVIDSTGYADKLVKSMTEAHGGWENWVSKSVMRFTSEKYHFTTPSPGTKSFDFADMYYYTIAIKPENSTGYASFSDGKARIFYDGTDIWTVGLTDQNNNLNRPPVILLFSTYSLINLPWLSQMDHVNLEYMGTGELPLKVGSYEIVRMTFEQRSGNKHEGYYELYIDPETNLLKGVKQATVLPQLPGTEFSHGVSSLSKPILHVFKSYEVIDNLYIPSSYVSYINGKLLGINFIQKISMSGDLDKTLVSPPNEVENKKDLGISRSEFQPSPFSEIARLIE